MEMENISTRGQQDASDESNLLNSREGNAAFHENGKHNTQP